MRKFGRKSGNQHRIDPQQRKKAEREKRLQRAAARTVAPQPVALKADPGCGRRDCEYYGTCGGDPQKADYCPALGLVGAEQVESAEERRQLEQTLKDPKTVVLVVVGPVCPLCQKEITLHDELGKNVNLVEMNGRRVQVHRTCPTEEGR